VASLAKLLHAKGSSEGRPARGLVSVCAAGGLGVVAILESA
jgi:acetyl-CoA C-acetyltransferase